MPRLSDRVVDLIESCLTNTSADAIGLNFFCTLKPLGAQALYARAYTSPADHGTAGQIFSRIAPARCDSAYADPRFNRHNPVPRHMMRATLPIPWSALRPKDAGERWVLRAAADLGCSQGILVPCHGPGGYVGVVSICFERLDGISPSERLAIEVASLVLHGRMRAFSADASRPDAVSKLSRRERDCLAFIAEGRSNSEIADLLGISAATVATHVAHARDKLGAKTRSQAVAAFLSGGGLG